MRTIKVFHGTNASNINDVIDNPRMTNCINGFGFFTTNDIEVARKFGKTVICWEMSVEVAEAVKFNIQPIDKSFEEGIRTHKECVEAGMEWVIRTQAGVNTMAWDCEDSFVVE